VEGKWTSDKEEKKRVYGRDRGKKVALGHNEVSNGEGKGVKRKVDKD